MLRFQRFASTYNQRAVLRKYPVGGIIHGFQVRRAVPVPELKLTAVDLIHEQTGAEHLHIDRDDKNNVFSIAFRTLPPDATGVPHILEHTTLCGSEKYPVRDPFFKMLNKSLANFMNAMTGPDYTFFPFATTNARDFVNLRDVYLNSTLRPLLKEQDFYQEGWRLEHSEVTNPKSDIIFKGVVFNEMKGQVSNADYHFWSQFQQNIYPSLNNSGGDPQKITDLHYQDLVDFHHANYHPSNARTFTYGSFPLEDTLKKVNEEFRAYGKRIINKKLPKPLELIETKELTLEGQIDPMLPAEKQTKTSLTWKCGEPTDLYETFLLKILGNLLLDGHDSIMYKGLIESGLGHDFSVNTGVESMTAANFLTVGIQGSQNVEEFKSKVFDLFREFIENDVDSNKVDAIIHQLELSKKDQKADFGLQILYSILPGWTNGIDPIEGLEFDELIGRLKSDFKENGTKIFKNILDKYIIDQPYFHFTMKGSEEFSSKLAAEESTKLDKKLKELDETDRKAIFERGLLLEAAQNHKEDLSCLPTLGVADISRKVDTYDLNTNANITVRNTATNGISYIRGKKLINDMIPLELYPFLSLFAASLTHLGTKTTPYGAIDNEIKLHTGGISTNISVNADPTTLQPNLYFDMSGFSLNEKSDYIFKFLKTILLETDFSTHKDKLKVLINSIASSNTSHIADSGHTVARSFASGHLSTVAAIQEHISGVEHYKLISRLCSIMNDDKLFQSEVIDKLVMLQRIIVNSQNMEFFASVDCEAQENKIRKEVDYFVSTLPNTSSDISGAIQTACVPRYSDSRVLNLIKFPFQVHYTAQAYNGVSYTHKDGAALQVLANMLTFKHLHKEIREKGGAYGGGATFSALSGIFSYYSYRDPNPLASIQTFEKSASYVLNDAKWTKSDLDESKLSIFQQVDAPISPKSEGSTFFNLGVTDEMRQVRREQLLDTSLLDIHRVAERYILPNKSITTVVGPGIDGETVSPKWHIEDIKV